MTNYGELGEKYPMEDTVALTDAIVKICRKANRTGIHKHIPKALEYAYKYFDWNRNAKKLAYMLFK
jgi:glycosyltransferase involved in cell wall biosynthesis